MSTQAEAIAAAGRVLAITRDEMAGAYAEGGAERVAREACPNGTPQQQENVARLYERLRRQSSKDSAA